MSQVLHLSEVRCEEVPACLGLLTSLTDLTLGVFHPNNDMTPVVHPDLGTLQQLVRLRLTHSCLHAIPAWVGNLPQLESLVMKNHCFQSDAGDGMLTNAAIAALLHSTQLTELRMTRCDLLSLPRELSRLSRLASLRLGESSHL